MKELVVINKPSGLTPLEAISQFKEKYPAYKEAKVSYAGRLDPLASGVMLLLVGDANKNREKYLALEKEYITKILFGITTDTLDPMGLVTNIIEAKIDRAKLQNALRVFTSSFDQEYPHYSSRTVNGKPLWWYAKNKLLDTITIPSKKVTIHTNELLSTENIRSQDLLKIVKSKIKAVKGDFRQDESIISWEKTMGDSKIEAYTIVTIKTFCSSGTYMRQLANNIGKKLGIPALALDINRTQVGPYKLKDTLGL